MAKEICIEKELANWIYWEQENNYYCSACIEKRLEEVNTNREFADNIDYEEGETCGYMQDYADSGDHENPEQEYCCKCHKPLFTLGID